MDSVKLSNTSKAVMFGVGAGVIYYLYSPQHINLWRLSSFIRSKRKQEKVQDTTDNNQSRPSIFN
jgi:hypothetical protein